MLLCELFYSKVIKRGFSFPYSSSLSKMTETLGQNFQTTHGESLNQVVESLKNVNARIRNVCLNHNILKEPRLVAVSKTKSASLVLACYKSGHLHFGENYVQEIVEKSKELPKDIQWHFIGHLQTNKCKQLIDGVSNLFMVETVDSVKLAETLNKCWKQEYPLKVLVQVNTSGESSKSGVPPSQCVDLAEYIMKELKCLKFEGLMTIGCPNASPDFYDFKIYSVWLHAEIK